MGKPEIDNVTIGDIVQTKLLTCTQSDTLLVASRKMAELRFSSILVLDGDEVIGIWTEKDSLKHDFSKYQSSQIPISEVMSSPVKSVLSTMTLEEVSSEFRKDGFRHYLVVDSTGKRLGIISQTDVVLKYSLEYYLIPRNVSSVLHAGIPMLSFDAPLTEAIKLMRELRVDALIVEFSNQQQGIITERDIIKAIAADENDPQVASYATQGLITINTNDSLYQAKMLMLDKKIRHLGVLDDKNQLISIINLESILEGMLNSYLEELRHVVDEQKKQLETSTAHLHLAHKVISATLEGVTITDAEGIIQSCNPAFTKITGYSESEVLGKTPAILSSGRHDKDFFITMWVAIQQQGFWQGEIWNRKKNGEIFPQLLSISAIKDESSNQVTHYAGLFSDISQSKANEEKIMQLAFYDPLTGLANRRLFFDRLEHQIAVSIRSKQLFALIFLDLDKFKPVNDTFGHAAGDALLRNVAEQLQLNVREADTIARIGGDEFVMILTNLDSDKDIASQLTKAVAKKVQDHITTPFSFEKHSLSISASIGITLFDDHTSNPKVLLKQADKAMYHSKSEGQNQINFYTYD